MKNITLTLLLFSFGAFAQDLVKLSNGAELNIKILDKNTETISFVRSKEGTLPYYISKIEIDEIRYENGRLEKPEHPKMNVSQAKDKIIADINRFSSDKDNNKITAAFEGNYLKLTADNGDYKKGMVFDLIKLIRFDETAYRREGFAFINIWTPVQINEAKDKWGRFKLILRVASHENAAILKTSIKEGNKVLKANRS
jgi:hypothetical protein